ncbi:MAG: hypothetical protein GY757_58330 [bacterium]|nr:hypothetical protein [bacterium]
MSEQNRDPKKLMAAYEAGPEQLDAALKGLSESQLDLSRAEGKWTIRQIVHHIADAEDLWETAIKAALGNTGCTFDFSWYILDNKCAVPLNYTNRPIYDAVALFKVLRRYVANMVKHLPNARERNIHLTRSGDELEEKTLVVDEILNWQVLHLEIHIKQILETRKVHKL